MGRIEIMCKGCSWRGFKNEDWNIGELVCPRCYKQSLMLVDKRLIELLDPVRRKATKLSNKDWAEMMMDVWSLLEREAEKCD